MKAKEDIFYCVLNGKRIEGIQNVPLLFKGATTFKDFRKSFTVSLVALFIPAVLIPRIIYLRQNIWKMKSSFFNRLLRLKKNA
jgi:hypothetical protein